MYKIIILLSLLTSCGSHNDSNGDGSSSSLSGNAAIETTRVQTDKTTGKQTVDISAKLVATINDLELCTDILKGSLAYVKDESTFYYCEGSWNAIELKGKDGTNGTNGKDGQDKLQSNEWISPLNGKKYVLFTVEQDKFSCPSGTSLPTREGGIAGKLFNTEISGAFSSLNKKFVYDAGTLPDGSKFVSWVDSSGFQGSVAGSDGVLPGSYPRTGPVICRIQ